MKRKLHHDSNNYSQLEESIALSRARRVEIDGREKFFKLRINWSWFIFSFISALILVQIGKVIFNMKIKIQIIREIFSDISTIGKLFIDGKFFCWTLEDKVRSPGIKIQNETAIPAGNYKLDINMSNHFKREMIQILDVPNFQGVRIHGGNSSKDTNACILVAFNKINNNLIQKTAEKEVFEYTKSQIKKGNDVWLSIINKRI